MIKNIDRYPVPIVCPYCNSSVIFTSNAEIYGRQYGNGMCYKCTECNSYVGVHTGTKIPLGRLADKELRELKKECHSLFDPVWQKNKNITRDMAYRILAELLEIHVNECHFGWFDKKTLHRAKQIMSKKYWERGGNEKS